MGEPEHRAWGAQKHRVQLLVLGGEGPESVCPCVRPADALRGALRPGLCGQVSEGSETTPQWFQCCPPNWGHGTYPVLPLDQRVKSQVPPAGGSPGGRQGDSRPRDCGLQFASEGLPARRPRRVSFLPFSRPASRSCPCPALCTLTGGSGPGCSGRLSD